MSTHQTLSYNEAPSPLHERAATPLPEENRLASCPPYHLYRDVMDSFRSDAPYPGVYLELTGPGVSFEAEPGRVVVCIPGPVWDRIIRVGPLGGKTVEIDSLTPGG